MIVVYVFLLQIGLLTSEEIIEWILTGKPNRDASSTLKLGSQSVGLFIVFDISIISTYIISLLFE